MIYFLQDITTYEVFKDSLKCFLLYNKLNESDYSKIFNNNVFTKAVGDKKWKKIIYIKSNIFQIAELFASWKDKLLTSIHGKSLWYVIS